jgi:hypothetical protein
MRTQYFFIVLAAVAVLFTACDPDKNHSEDKDYREKWVGSYECEEKYGFYPLEGEMVEKTYQTKVEITVGGGDSILNFTENRNGQSYAAKVNSDGKFRKLMDHPLPKPLIEGYFNNDSLYMTINFNGGALGYAEHSDYNGKKFKNK